MDFFKTYAKAFVGAATAGITYLIGVLDPTSTPADLTFVQYLGLALAVLGTFGAVGVVENKLTEKQKTKAVAEVIAEQRAADAGDYDPEYIPKH